MRPRFESAYGKDAESSLISEISTHLSDHRKVREVMERRGPCGKWFWYLLDPVWKVAKRDTALRCRTNEQERGGTHLRYKRDCERPHWLLCIISRCWRRECEKAASRKRSRPVRYRHRSQSASTSERGHPYFVHLIRRF